MTEYEQSSSGGESIQKAHKYLQKLGEFAIGMAGIERAPRYPNGTHESDTDHTFHLALSAPELAKTLAPDLDPGLVSLFANVHDLPEYYSKDVWTFDITAEDLAKKKATEKLATERLLREAPPYTASLLERYEQQIEPEARFVRFIDKLLPSIIDAMAGEASTFKKDFNVNSIEELLAKRVVHIARLKEMFPEFSDFDDLVTLVWDMSAKQIFGDTK